MKKTIFFLIAFFLFFVFSFTSYADDIPDLDINEDGVIIFDYIRPSISETGHVIDGVIHWYGKKMNNDFDYLRDYVKLYNFTNVQGLYVVHESSGMYTLHDIDGYINCKRDSVATYSGNYYFGQDFSDSNDGVRPANYYKVSTNIPIFEYDDTDGIDAYINGGDFSNATNFPEIDDLISEESSDIENPRNLKVTGGYYGGLGQSSAYSFDKDFSCEWSQTVDTSNYLFDVDYRVTIGVLLYPGVLNGGFTNVYTSEWTDFIDGNSYLGSKSLAVTIPKKKLNALYDNLLDYIVKTEGTYKTKSYLISRLEVRVRNRVLDVGSSNYVVATIDYDNASTTGEVRDDEDNVIEDDEYGGGSVDNRDDYDVSGDISINSLMSFIKDGFGLLGDNGIISLMSQTFLYLPSTIWTMIYFFVSMMIVIGIIGLVKGLF